MSFSLLLRASWVSKRKRISSRCSKRTFCTLISLDWFTLISTEPPQFLPLPWHLHGMLWSPQCLNFQKWCLNLLHAPFELLYRSHLRDVSPNPYTHARPTLRLSEYHVNILNDSAGTTGNLHLLCIGGVPRAKKEGENNNKGDAGIIGDDWSLLRLVQETFMVFLLSNRIHEGLPHATSFPNHSSISRKISDGDNCL